MQPNVEYNLPASKQISPKNYPNKCTYIVFNNLKFTLKHLKRSYMFRSYDHPQGAYISKEQSMLPEDDRMIETCRSVLSVLM